MFAVVLVGVVVIAGALAEHRYSLAAVVLAVVAVGLPVAGVVVSLPGGAHGLQK
jgi:hypothetical protein